MKFRDDFLSLKNTKALQGIAAIAIILLQLIQEVTDCGAVWMGAFWASIFFFFSGYGLLKRYQTTPGYLDTFLEKRFPVILLPFLISNLLYLIFEGFYMGKVARVTDMLTCLTGFTLLNTNSWFLVEIMILYLAFYLIYKRSKNSDKAFSNMIFFVFLLIVLSLFLGHDHSEINGHWFMGEWWYNATITFLFGMLVAKYEAPIIAFAQRQYCRLFPLAGLAFACLYFMLQYTLNHIGYYREWEGHPGYGEKAVTLVAQMPACILFVIVILLLSMKVKWHNPVTNFVGKISLELYIIYDLMMQVIRYVYDEISDGTFFFMVFLYSFVAATILHFLVHQKLIELWENEREKDRQEPETLEAKQRLQKKKEWNKKLRKLSIIIGCILTILVTREAYDKYIVPELNYKEEVAQLTMIQVGEKFLFGCFDIEAGGFEERIEWLVVDKKDDMVLLVAEKALHPLAFQPKYENTSWENSNIRSILNHDFLEMAFSEKEQNLIQTTHIVTEDNAQYGTESGSDTFDKVFLLSIQEAEQYFPDEVSRKLMPTEIALRNGINVNPNSFSSWWWLRNMGAESNMVAVVTVKGQIDLKGERVNIISGAVRPAIWVKCK